jgi:hypothetical protein
MAGDEDGFSMDKDMGDAEAYRTPQKGGNDDEDVDFTEWQVAGRTQRNRKPKRPAERSPIVEKTPAKEAPARPARGAEGGEDDGGRAPAKAAAEGSGVEPWMRKVAAFLEESRAAMDAVLSAVEGPFSEVDAEVRARLAASREVAAALSAGMAFQRLRDFASDQRRAAQELKRERKELERDRKAPAGAAAARGSGCSWRDIAVAPPSAARAPLAWNARCSFFLHPLDPATLTRTFDLAEFDDAFTAFVKGVPGASDGGRPVRQIVRTGRGAVRMEVSPAVAPFLEATADRGTPVQTEKFGAWRVERQRPSAAPSLVAMGVSPALSDQDVTERVLAGSRALVPENLRGELGELRVSRLRSKRRGPPRGATSSGGQAREDAGAGGRDELSAPTRSVRIFGKSAIIDGFLKLGYIKLGGVVLRVREYAPPTAYCAVCKRQGSHDTASHRFVSRAQTDAGRTDGQAA